MSLENLCLEECNLVSLFGLRDALANCRGRLKSLTLVKCTGIRESALGTMTLPACESLTSLNIRHCPGFGNGCLALLGRACPQVQCIDLSGLCGICDDGCSEDIFLMSDKGKQGELGREANKDVRNYNSRSNSLASKEDKSRTLGELCDQRSCKVPVVNGVAFTRCGGKHFKGDDLSLMRKEENDCLSDLNAVPNHWQLIQQFIPTNTEGIMNDLSQCKEVKDADVHISDEDCLIPGERSTEKHATTGSFSMPEIVVNIDCKDLGKNEQFRRILRQHNTILWWPY